ncbi:hypothetical protein V491_04204, partial [Pseudogymnoascus sp. VKM F-3775]
MRVPVVRVITVAVRGWWWALRGATALPYAIVHAFQETLVNRRGTGCAIATQFSAIGIGMVVPAIEAELRLDGCTMDATGDDLGVGELPDMDVVAGDDAGDVLDVLFNVVNVKVVGGGLQKDLGGRRGQGDGGAEDDECDEERNGRIS